MIKHPICLCIFFLFLCFENFSFRLFAQQNNELTREEILTIESKQIFQQSVKFAKLFYSLEEGEELKELTQILLESEETKDSIKEKIVASGRRFFLFKYPSDGFQVKGLISFVPDSEKKPLLILLRGGNRIFSLLHPASNLTCVKDYTVLITTYRGGVSEGDDEFGGAEVDDIDHLLEYFPILQEKIGICLAPEKTYIVGKSRGGMEMFLALNRSKTLQYRISKAVSVSGLLDIEECMRFRRGMREMFIRDFGLEPGKNEEEWIARRNPIKNIYNLRKDLPILILQGSEDERVSLNEGYHMVNALESGGHLVTYMEVPGANHTLENRPDRMDIIVNWLEQ